MKTTLIMLLLACASSLTLKAQTKGTSYKITRATENIEHKQYQEALELLDTELGNNPQCAEAYYLRSYIYSLHDMHANVIADSNFALKYATKKEADVKIGAHLLLGDEYAVVGDTAKALSHLSEAIVMDDDNEATIHRHINLLHSQKRYDEERRDIELLKQQWSQSSLSNVYIGRYYLTVKDYDNAQAHMDLAVKLSPSSAKPYFYRAKCYMEQQKWREAAEDVVQGSKIDFDNMGYGLMKQLADSSFVHINTSLKAQRMAEKNNYFWPYCLGCIYASQRRYQEALDYYQEAFDKASGNNAVLPYINKKLSEVHQNLGNYAEAISRINQVIEVDSTDVEWRQQRMTFYEEQCMYDKAIAEADYIISLYPDASVGYYERGAQEYYAKRMAEALDDLSIAIVLEPRYEAALVTRGCVYRALDMEDEARADFEKVLGIVSADCNTDDIYYRIYALAQLGRSDEAYALFTEQARTHTITYGGPYPYLKSRCLALMGREDEALTMLECSIEHSARAYYGLDDEPDLDAIRQNPRYANLQKQYADRMQPSSESVEAAENFDDIDPSLLETTEIPFTKDDGGTYAVKCTINGLPLSFTFDTGAATVSISNLEASFMLKNGYLDKSDLKYKTYFGDANGDISQGTIINLRKVEFGGLVLENVEAGVVHNQKAPLLLGQTVFSRLGKIEIDYATNTLRITRKKQLQK